MSFTKQEVYEYLSAYPNASTTIPMVLVKLGYDESTEEFPDDIVEKAEIACKELGIAVESSKKRLLGSIPEDAAPDTKSEAIDLVVRESSEVAFKNLDARGIKGLSKESMLVIVQAAVAQEVQFGEAVNEIRFQAIQKTLKEGDKRIAKTVLESMQATKSQVNTLLSESTVGKIINAAVPDEEGIDVKAFLEEMKQDRQEQAAGKQQKVAATVTKHQEQEAQEIDVDTLLKEIYG